MTTELSLRRDTADGLKETLVNDLKGAIGDADKLLKEVADFTADEFVAARTKIESRLNDARSSVHHARLVATRQACGAYDATHDYVRENPLKVLGVAAAAGLFAAFLLSRR